MRFGWALVAVLYAFVVTLCVCIVGTSSRRDR